MVFGAGGLCQTVEEDVSQRVGQSWSCVCWRLNLSCKSSLLR